MNHRYISLMFICSLAACDKAAPPPPSPSPTTMATGEGVFKQVCHACHAMGVAGAPKLGDREQWRKRVEQGSDQLYRHAMQGFTGTHGTMPPRGGKPDLSDADVKAAVDFMVSKVPPG
jgi:cytochrome c5